MQEHIYKYEKVRGHRHNCVTMFYYLSRSEDDHKKIGCDASASAPTPVETEQAEEEVHDVGDWYGMSRQTVADFKKLQEEKRRENEAARKKAGRAKDIGDWYGMSRQSVADLKKMQEEKRRENEAARAKEKATSKK